MIRFQPIATLCAAGLLLGACVTETQTPSRGVRVKPKSDAARAETTPAKLPAGPVAKPASGVTTSAAVRVTFIPLGNVIYDGQALPIVSPDGRFLAAQSGEAPSWPTILAEPEAEPTFRTTLTVLDISGAALRPLGSTQTLPGGLMLGRAGDNQGFLVESQQRDGARWIGKAHWLTGNVDWLAQGEAVNAHGVLTPSSGLLFTRRASDSRVSELVLKEGNQESVLQPVEGSYWYPMVGDDPSLVFALRVSPRGTDIEVIRVKSGRLDSIVLTRSLSTSTDPLLAHQIGATATGPSFNPGVEPAPLTALSPRHGRMAVLDVASGIFEPLAPKSVAAVRSTDPTGPGYFCTTPEGLTFIPKVGLGGQSGVPVTMISSPYVPRAVSAQPPQLILVGPVKGAPDRLEVVRMLLRSEGP